MYSRHPNLGCDVLFAFTPSSYLLICSAISSITVAYISTESTPPCLMLSLIFISLVLPYFVFIVAVRFVFMSFVIYQFSVSIPLLLSTYSSASSHALSYAFVTSRYTIYRGFFLFCCVAMLSFSIVRWSVVDFLSLPPACASDIFICGRVRLSIIRSYTFPMLLDTAFGKGKKGKCSNERGITVSSNIGKVYERIIDNRTRPQIKISEA